MNSMTNGFSLINIWGCQVICVFDAAKIEHFSVHSSLKYISSNSLPYKNYVYILVFSILTHILKNV